MSLLMKGILKNAYKKVALIMFYLHICTMSVIPVIPKILFRMKIILQGGKTINSIRQKQCLDRIAILPMFAELTAMTLFSTILVSHSQIDHRGRSSSNVSIRHAGLKIKSLMA